MRKTIIVSVLVAALTGCSTMRYHEALANGATQAQAEQIRDDSDAQIVNALSIFAAGAGGYQRARPTYQAPAPQPRLPVYTTCTSNRYTGVNCISQ